MKKFLSLFISMLIIGNTHLFLAKAMNITIDINISGVTELTVEVESGDSIDNVKQKIEDSTGYPVSKQILMFNNRVLSDDRTLADYNIQKESTVKLYFSKEIYQGSDKNYKFSILDCKRKFDIQETTATATKGQKLSFDYTGATVGDNEYISAILTDKDNNYIYYHTIEKVKSENGKIYFTVPNDLKFGKYTLSLFNEQISDDYTAAFTSDFENIELNVKPEYYIFEENEEISTFTNFIITFLNTFLYILLSIKI